MTLKCPTTTITPGNATTWEIIKKTGCKCTTTPKAAITDLKVRSIFYKIVKEMEEAFEISALNSNPYEWLVSNRDDIATICKMTIEEFLEPGKEKLSEKVKKHNKKQAKKSGKCASKRTVKSAGKGKGTGKGASKEQETEDETYNEDNE